MKTMSFRGSAWKEVIEMLDPKEQNSDRKPDSGSCEERWERMETEERDFQEKHSTNDNG